MTSADLTTGDPASRVGDVIRNWWPVSAIDTDALFVARCGVGVR
jgi:hypothetical protein